MYLFGFSWRAQDALWEFLKRGAVTLLSVELRDFARMRELMKKYQDLPMDLADAALVRVAERETIRRIFTLDRRDFSLYRPEGVPPFKILLENCAATPGACRRRQPGVPPEPAGPAAVPRLTCTAIAVRAMLQ
jgi:hypothetical protein